MTPDTMIPSPQPLSLKQRLLQAETWSLSGYGLSQSLRLGGNLAMARLLVPEMFGLMAIANLLIVSLTLLSDLGLRQNIIQSRRGDDPGFLDTAWTVQIVRGVLLGAAALALAGTLYLAQGIGLPDPATAYGDPLLPPVLAWIAASAPIAGCQSIRVVTAVRHLQHRKVVWTELAGQAAGIAVSLAWAWTDPSIWSLVAGNLAAALAATLASHLLLPGPSQSLAWDRTAVTELLGFGRRALVSSAIGILAVSADRLFLGAVANGLLLGLYSIGHFIVTALENGTARLFITLSLPAMSETACRNRVNLRIAYHRLLAPFDLFLFFIAGFLFTGGEHLVALLYDPRYAQAGGILAVLSLGLPSLRFSMAYQLYLALGLPHLMTLIGLVRLAALAILLPAGFWQAGFTGAVWGIALHNFLTAPFILYFNWRLGIADFGRELRALPCFPLGLALGWLAGPALTHLGLVHQAAGRMG